MNRVLSYPVWLVISLVWAGFIAYLGVTNAPYVPLDMSAADGETQAALEAALSRHVIAYGMMAALPPLLLLGVVAVLRRGRPG